MLGNGQIFRVSALHQPLPLEPGPNRQDGCDEVANAERIGGNNILAQLTGTAQRVLQVLLCGGIPLGREAFGGFLVTPARQPPPAADMRPKNEPSGLINPLRDLRMPAFEASAPSSKFRQSLQSAIVFSWPPRPWRHFSK